MKDTGNLEEENKKVVATKTKNHTNHIFLTAIDIVDSVVIVLL
jgi:hypothetical protein